MNIYPVADALSPLGLSSPQLNALVPDAQNYKALLIQPRGEIEATSEGIRSCDAMLAQSQFGAFLTQAVQAQHDLVVTPEYSMPWDTLKAAISTPGGGPAEGKLWVLGCESIRYSELQAMKDNLSETATLIFEEQTPVQNKFLDPLAYVFRTTSSEGGSARLVVVVQFKTRAMADLHDLERNNLQLGERIYRFGIPGTSISLLTFICSDMLAFQDEDARAVYDRALILHIQLNPKRQHTSMRGFRDRLLRLGGSDTEILTLNWARETSIRIDENQAQRSKFAGSSWCLKADKIDLSDELVADNHRRGLYYTWMESLRTHAMYFNFAPAIFEVTASKVFRLGLQGPENTRRGPALDASLTWDGSLSSWTNSQQLSDEFDALCPEADEAEASIRAAYMSCPCGCERLLAICAGEAFKSDGWHHPQALDSFVLGADELIRRLTFCQPSHNDEASFRLQRLRKCARLWHALQDTGSLPLALRDLSAGFSLEWTRAAQHQNLRSLDNSHARATVMHLENATEVAAQAAFKRTLQCLHTSMEEAPGHKAKQRVVVWYFDAQGSLKKKYRTPEIDAQLEESPVDIGRLS